MLLAAAASHRLKVKSDDVQTFFGRPQQLGTYSATTTCWWWCAASRRARIAIAR